MSRNWMPATGKSGNVRIKAIRSAKSPVFTSASPPASLVG